MSSTALVINLNADPADLLTYLANNKDRCKNMRLPDPVANSKNINLHNNLVLAVNNTLSVGNVGAFVLGSLIIPNVPTTPASSAIAANSATLSCDAMPGATSYNYQYRVKGTANFIPAGTALTGLAPSTTYEWQVQGVYPGGNSDWSATQTFTTPAAA